MEGFVDGKQIVEIWKMLERCGQSATLVGSTPRTLYWLGLDDKMDDVYPIGYPIGAEGDGRI